MSDTALPVYLHYGTDAQRLAFTPSPPATGQPIYVWYATDTTITWLYDTSWHQVTSGSSLVSPWSQIITGRLTTESGVPVSVTDRTAQGTIYFTPAIDGNAITNGQIALYSGSAVVNVAFTQLSLALTVTSGKNYDVFVDYNSGTPQLVLSAAWTTDTARADALGVQSGLIVKNGTSAYRWVGTIRASGANVTADSLGGATTQVGGQRFVWNAYNQVPRALAVIDTTDSWSYTTDTIRQAGGASGNKVEYVTGLASQLVDAAIVGNVSVASGSARGAKIGIGVDSTSTFSGLVGELFNNDTTTTLACLGASYRGLPGLGYHFLSWNEKGSDGTCSFRGDNGGDSSQSGLTAWLMA